MTEAKKLKRKIRERAARTGESYAVARAHILTAVDQSRAARSEAAAQAARVQPATGAVTETRCREVTGHGFDHWFGVLDRFSAPKQGHRAAARHLQDDHALSAWYAQAITVLYERARRLRALNQSSGGFQVSVSRVWGGTFEAIKPYLTNESRRTAWLETVDEEVVQAVEAAVQAGLREKEGAVWVRGPVAGGRVELRISATEDGRSRAVARVEQLPDAQTAEAQRATWRCALDALKRAADAA